MKSGYFTTMLNARDHGVKQTEPPVIMPMLVLIQRRY